MSQLGLNEAIRRGCRMRPQQAFRQLFHGRDGACVVGAAVIGGRGYDATEEDKSLEPPQFASLVSDLPVNVSCPHPGCSISAWTGEIMRLLNNDHRWSREAIAEWADPQPELHVQMPKVEAETKVVVET